MADDHEFMPQCWPSLFKPSNSELDTSLEHFEPETVDDVYQAFEDLLEEGNAYWSQFFVGYFIG